MSPAARTLFTVAAALVAMIPLAGTGAYAQDNPYRIEQGWAKPPTGRKLGSTSGVDVDRDGNIWAFERCGERSCADSNLAPVFKFDPSGRYLTSFGAGMFVFPHGMHVDKNDTIYVSDSQSDAKRNPGFRRGIRVCSAKDGSIRALIPGVGSEPDTETVPEGVAADATGNVFGGQTSSSGLTKYNRGS